MAHPLSVLDIQLIHALCLNHSVHYAVYEVRSCPILKLFHSSHSHVFFPFRFYSVAKCMVLTQVVPALQVTGCNLVIKKNGLNRNILQKLYRAKGESSQQDPYFLTIHFQGEGMSIPPCSVCNRNSVVSRISTSQSSDVELPPVRRERSTSSWPTDYQRSRPGNLVRSRVWEDGTG